MAQEDSGLRDRSLYEKVFPKDHKSDKEALEELRKQELPMEKRFPKSVLEKISQLLDQGYGINKYNEFGKDSKYLTVLEFQGNEESFITDYALPEISGENPEDKKNVLIARIDKLLNSMESLKN